MILTPCFIKKEIRKNSKGIPERVHCYRSLDQIRTVLLLFDAPKLNEIQPCIRQLEERNIKVTSCAYTREKISGWPPSILLIYEKQDVNRLGFPSPNLEKQFRQIPADLLIDLTGLQSHSMHLLMLKHPSHFKVGTKPAEGEQLHDLSITMTDKNDISYLFEQILFYLQSIRSE